MVIYDQLRISDDGQSIFIDAHVNKATYFDNVYLKRITICKEDQVSETNPTSFGDNFIYQEDIEEVHELHPIYDTTQTLSEKNLLSKINEYGGWQINYEAKADAVNNYVSILFSGKFSQMDTELTPILVVSSNAFNPLEDSLNSPEVLFTANGTSYSGQGHNVWQFKNKGKVNQNEVLNFYLYYQNPLGTYNYVRLDETDDINFLHFFWQIYSVVPKQNRKELHLVLNKNSFNEKFTAGDLSYNMFFVYIECDGVPSSDTPCTLDEMTTLAVTFDYGIIFNQALNYTKQLQEECDVPQEFVDFILNYNALKLAIETEHFIPAIQFWKYLSGINGSNSYKLTKPCRCNG